jgi:hypothetical protein
MIDISKHKSEVHCPQCKRPISFSMRQVANEETITCRCGQKIGLKDSNGSAKKSIRDINKSFKDLERAFKRLGK